MSSTNHQASENALSLLHVGAWTDASPYTGPGSGLDGLGQELDLLSSKGKDQGPPPKASSSTKTIKGSKASAQRARQNKSGMSTWLNERSEGPWTPYQVAATFNTAANLGTGGQAHASDSKSAGANDSPGFQG